MSGGVVSGRDAVERALLPVLMAEYGGTEDDWTAMHSLRRVADALLASGAVREEAAVRAEVVAQVETICEEATERAYWDISMQKELTVQPNGPGRAKVPGHWREAAEGEARVTVVDLRKALADVPPAAGRELATNPERGPRCGECRLGLGVHEPRDPQCVRHDEAAR